jgi:hypothetical protein
MKKRQQVLLKSLGISTRLHRFTTQKTMAVFGISHIGMKIERILLAVSAKHKVRPMENNVMNNKA